MTIQIPAFKHRLFWDSETRSPIDIKRGSYVYAEHSEIIMGQYALDEGPVQIWDAGMGQPMPKDLHDYFSASHLVQIAAHNTSFDRVQMMYWQWARKYDLNVTRWFCTATAARLAGMPGGLDALCQALGMPENYSKKDGNALIRWFCIPIKGTNVYNQPHDHPDKWADFIAYGIRDVEAMREAMRRIPQTYNPVEQALMAYTDMMNDRGLPIDRQLATTAMRQADMAKVAAKREATRLVNEDWEMDPEEEFNPASQKAIIELASDYGIKLEDARAATLEKMLDSADAVLLPPVFRKLLGLRVRTNKAATSKYKAILTGANTDDRCRGLITFYGANRTGRDAGRRVQPQNLARPVYVGDPKDGKIEMERACQMVIDGTAFIHVDNPMQLYADCVRGAIAAPKGKKFCTADLSAIEGRTLPWLAGEEWKLQYFRDYDAGKIKVDDYKMTYAKAFNISPELVTKDQRQLGKVLVLACGFGGGVGALVTFAALYRIDPQTLADAARAGANPVLWEECYESFDWFEDHGLTYGMDRDVWTGCQYLIKAWRGAHPETTKLWKSAENAFRSAINNPGVRFPMANHTSVHSEQGWVFITLPSGRQLVCPHAHELPREGKRAGGLAFYGVNPFTKRWGLIYTHGARLVENITQAVARDVLMWAIPEAEHQGYEIVMRVHDEFIAEVPDDMTHSGRELARIMSLPHSWCLDLPLAAVGEDLYRYQK